MKCWKSREGGTCPSALATLLGRTD